MGNFHETSNEIRNMRTKIAIYELRMCEGKTANVCARIHFEIIRLSCISWDSAERKTIPVNIIPRFHIGFRFYFIRTNAIYQPC